jgi:hypothetical protein
MRFFIYDKFSLFYAFITLKENYKQFQRNKQKLA